MRSDSPPNTCLHPSESRFCYPVYQLEKPKRNGFVLRCLNKTQTEATDGLFVGRPTSSRPHPLLPANLI